MIAMRTTLDLDEDVLLAAKQHAKHYQISIGAAVSKLVRQALIGTPTTPCSPTASGFIPFPARGVVVSERMIEQLREAEGI